MSSMRVLFSHIKKKLNSREIKSPLKATKLIKNIQFQLAPRPSSPFLWHTPAKANISDPIPGHLRKRACVGGPPVLN